MFLLKAGLASSRISWFNISGFFSTILPIAVASDPFGRYVYAAKSAMQELDTENIATTELPKWYIQTSSRITFFERGRAGIRRRGPLGSGSLRGELL
jgi:hypothetical protein